MTNLSPAPQLEELIELFYPDSRSVGQFSPVDARQCPEPYHSLLAHQAHMTVTVERHHGQLVDVQVLRDQVSGDSYQREILLRTQSNRRVVQYGIVRLRLSMLSEQVKDQILAGDIPLGRVLIQHDVMRQVQLGVLWRVQCGPVLANYFDCPNGTISYGRTALIYLDCEPAIELLEIVAPEITTTAR